MTRAAGVVRVAVVVDSDAFGGAETWVRRVVEHRPGVRRVVEHGPEVRRVIEHGPEVRRVIEHGAGKGRPTVLPSLVVSHPVADRLGTPSGLARRLVVPLARGRDRAPELAEALALLDPDVVHVNLVDPTSNRAALDAALAQAPTVATLHLDGEPPGVDARSAGPTRGDVGELRRRYCGLAEAIAPSAPIAARLAELGVPVERITRVRHGVPLPATPARPPGREPLVVGAVGRLTAQKGFDLLLAATARLVARGRSVEVVIAGTGRDEAVLRGQAAGLPVRFLGFVADVPAMLRRIDLFCLPSRSEALSLAVLEAAAHGLPCVTTSVGDTVAALSGAALIVPPNDVAALTEAMDRLLADPRSRRALGERARARALAAFRVERMAREVSEVWARAAGSRGGRGAALSRGSAAR
jgi:glycosyltransferase involved in cell wall biosynthesis